MKRFFIAIALMIGIVSQSYSQDYPVIAKEYCDCFSKLKDSMEVEFQSVLMRVVADTNIRKAFQKEMQAMEPDKRMRFATQLEFIGTSMETENNEAGKCGAALDARYKQYSDTPEREKLFNSKMVSELNRKSECKFLASLITFALAFSSGEED